MHLKKKIWPHSSYGGSQVRDWIWAAAVTYSASAARPAPLTHCARLGIKPVSCWQQLTPLPLDSFFFFLLFRASPMAYGGFQARGLTGATAAGLRHSHSNARSRPHRWPHHRSQQRWILNPMSEARDWTRTLMVPSQTHFCCATTGNPWFSIYEFCSH